MQPAGDAPTAEICNGKVNGKVPSNDKSQGVEKTVDIPKVPVLNTVLILNFNDVCF